ncbi:MAG: A/G-specific adenine glycosylase [Candidatus Berkiellales bacterium]
MNKTLSKNWFAKQLLNWYSTEGRHDLPWKKPISAYRIWVSEIMLQQTQVSTVIPYFARFMKAFPTIKKLADAPLNQVLHYWSGLGYYARARNLHQTAQIVATKYQKKFPQNGEDLQALPGIGRSTAGAILAQAFDIFAPILDGNVKRVLCRFHCIEGNSQQKEVEQTLWEIAEKYTPTTAVADYTQAIMDLGATCCTRSTPNCQACPLKTRCLAFSRNAVQEYPHKKVKTTLPHREITMLLARHQDAILLYQRPLQGIWAGLWSLPEFNNSKELKQFLREHLPLKKTTLKELTPLIHTFTHFRLKIQPILLHLNQKKSTALNKLGLTWVNAHGLTQRGLPAPIKKLIFLHAN